MAGLITIEIVKVHGKPATHVDAVIYSDALRVKKCVRYDIEHLRRTWSDNVEMLAGALILDVFDERLTPAEMTAATKGVRI